MRRFCSLNVQPDLFSGFAIVKELGRIGSRGRMMGELHQTEVLAAAYSARSRRSKRRGYVPGGAIRG
jgi:predicted DNA-binding WGR domain protein